MSERVSGIMDLLEPSNHVLTPGSPEASPGAGNDSPSVCSTSYLGIPQPGLGNAAVVAERGHLRGPNSSVRGDA